MSDRKGDRYSTMDESTIFGFMASGIGGGGNRDNAYPMDDAVDQSCGARFIPGEVTLARRRGENIAFVRHCNVSCCWYWLMPDGSRIYHWDRFEYEQIAAANKRTKDDKGDYPDGVGPCPQCGNVFTNGGTITKEQIETATK